MTAVVHTAQAHRICKSVQAHRIDHQGRDEYIQQGANAADVAPEDEEAEEVCRCRMRSRGYPTSARFPVYDSTAHWNRAWKTAKSAPTVALFLIMHGMQVRESDLLVVAAKAEEEAASLEVWLFEDADADGERNAYIHHDIPLPAFPLAVSWMRFNPSGLPLTSLAIVLHSVCAARHFLAPEYPGDCAILQSRPALLSHGHLDALSHACLMRCRSRDCGKLCSGKHDGDRHRDLGSGHSGCVGASADPRRSEGL